MPKLLYVESSPRKQRSKSIRVANEFLDQYRNQNPSDDIQTLDLWEIALPEFDNHTIDAKYQVMRGGDFDDNQAQAWQDVVRLCDEFKSADKLLISLPMWNFGIPYKLKHYIDLIAQPGQTFSYSPDSGYSGLVVGKPITVIYARGGAYGSDNPQGLDLQKGYMDLLLGFLGFTEIHSILVEPTAASPDDVAAAEAKAIEAARGIAASF